MSESDSAQQSAQSQSQSQSQSQGQTKSADPASRFLVGILGTLFVLIAICTVVLIKPHLVRAIRRLETAREQRVAVERTIEKRRLARKPRLRNCWLNGDERVENYNNYGTRWADLQPLGAELGYTPPPAYTSLVASRIAVPVAISPIPPSTTELASIRRSPVQRTWTSNPDGLVQLTVFVAMPTPSRPLYPSRSRHAATSTPSAPSTPISPYTRQGSMTSIDIQQGLTLGVTLAPFIPNHPASVLFSASKSQKQP